MTERMTAAEYRAMLARGGSLPAPPARDRKYGNKPTLVGAEVLDSAKEADRYQDLLLEEKAGTIRNLKRQTRFPLVVNERLICTYRCDFDYEREIKGVWRRVIEDPKGVKPKDFKLKWELCQALFPHYVWVLS